MEQSLTLKCQTESMVLSQPPATASSIDITRRTPPTPLLARPDLQGNGVITARMDACGATSMQMQTYEDDVHI